MTSPENKSRTMNPERGRDIEGKPKGTFQCSACDQVWDGSELYRDEASTAERFTCGDACCGASVTKVSDKPKADYLEKN